MVGLFFMGKVGKSGRKWNVLKNRLQGTQGSQGTQHNIDFYIKKSD